MQNNGFFCYIRRFWAIIFPTFGVQVGVVDRCATFGSYVPGIAVLQGHFGDHKWCKIPYIGDLQRCFKGCSSLYFPRNWFQ